MSNNQALQPRSQSSLQTSARKDIRSLLQSEKVKEEIALALPKHLTADRMTRVALTTINRTPKLLQCTPESLLSGLMLCSQVGLEPDGRNAHLIPYGDQVQVIFDWKGLVALARRNGVRNIAADVVCEGDKFEWRRTADGLQFQHEVDWTKKRGSVYAAYCIWKDGEQFDGEVMTKDEIEAIRKRSRAGNAGPWVSDWTEMAKKTVIRRASKKWPLDPETAAAFNADDDQMRDIEPVRPTSRPSFAAKPAPMELAPPPPDEPAMKIAPPEDDDIPFDDAQAQPQEAPAVEQKPEPVKPKQQPQAEPAPAAVDESISPVAALKNMIAAKGWNEQKFAQAICRKHKLSPCDDLETLFEISPGRIAAIVHQWNTVAPEIEKLMK